jgi:protein-tyrosine phosphatase
MDDGADTLETAVEMLKVAHDAGTTDIVATPHSDSKYTFRPDLIAERIRELDAILAGRPNVHRGCDFHLSYENIEDAIAQPRKYTVNGKCFLLVEFADAHVPQATASILERLMTSDMFPIITHPERNPILSRKLDQLASWVERGSFVQVTAKSLEGGFGASARDSAWKMLSRGIVHFVASDAHDPEYRPPRLDRAFELVSRKLSREAAELLFVSNPSAVIYGQDPATVVAAETGRKRSFFDFLKR